MKRLTRDFCAIALVAGIILSAVVPSQAYAKGQREAVVQAKLSTIAYVAFITAVVTETAKALVIEPAKNAINRYIVEPIREAFEPDPPVRVCEACQP